MLTVLSDWTLVYLFGLPDGSDMNKRWGRLLLGAVVMDTSGHYVPGQQICTSPIIRSVGDSMHTRDGRVFTLVNSGAEVELPVTMLPKLQALTHIDEIMRDIPHNWQGTE